jgi:hypothetical protein
MSASGDPKSLTAHEAGAVASLKRDIRHGNAEYLAAHPELATIVEEFVREVVAKAPEDVVAFAREHFGAPAKPPATK